ncbi:MAG: hypothetical protein KDB40_06480 [Acidimicrobiales bacterium]|nr:hypothetical protein [Acidimicrobiales bacterium]MCB9395116.1 hypothetical protein [Acidimicrobiaceae bacterium]
MFTFLELTVHQQVATDRRRRFRDAGRRSRRHRAPVAPDLIRTADLVPTVLPVVSSGSAVRVDPAPASSVAVGG